MRHLHERRKDSKIEKGIEDVAIDSEEENHPQNILALLKVPFNRELAAHAVTKE